MIKTFYINSTLAPYNDEEFAWLQSLLLNQGIIGDSVGALGMAVTQLGSPGMGVQVSAGKALVQITKGGRTFKVVVSNDAVVTPLIANNATGSNRVDAIIVRVNVTNEPNVSKSNIGTIETVLGSGTSPLSDGAITALVGSDGWYRLANITVANGAVSILNGSIADVRSKVTFNDGVGFSPLLTTSSAGVADAGKIPKLDAGGRLDPSFFPDAVFGDGSDGNIVLDGSTDFTSVGFGAPSSSIYTMTRNVYANNLTINNGVEVRPNGFRIYVKGTLTGIGTAKITYNGSNGGNATGSTAGTGASAVSTTGQFVNIAGGNGTNGGSSGNNATTASTPSAQVGVIGGAGVRGGRGGGRNDSADTTPGTPTSTAPIIKFPTLRALVLMMLDLKADGTFNKLVPAGGAGGGSGGNGYTASGSGVGGGGGGGGASGGIVAIFALNLVGTITIEAKGGNGGNGVQNTANGGGGGGGAGGSGGAIVLVYGYKTWTATYTVTGGTAGGTGTNGNAPNVMDSLPGNAGVTYQIPLSSLL